jgi:vancomycin resistance protein YoaR
MARHRRSSRRTPRWGLVAIAVPVGVLVMVTSAWAVDTATGSDVVRNVEVAGIPAGGNSAEAVEAQVQAWADALATTPVEVRTAAGNHLSTAADLGLTVDVEATTDAALDAGRGFVLLRPVTWLASFWSPHEVDPVLVVDEATTAEGIVAAQGETRVPPTEPTFSLADDGTLALVAGVDGTGIDPDALADALPAATLARTADDEPIVVELEPVPIAPTLGDDEVQALVDDLNARTSVPLTVVLDSHTADIAPEVVRSWLRPVPDEATGEPTYQLDPEATMASLREALADAGSGPVDARFDLVGGQVTIVPSSNGTGCCAEDSPQRIRDTIEQDAHTVSLELVTATPELTTEEAQSWGIAQVVGGSRAWPESATPSAAPGFTTFHQSGTIASQAGRVHNIHRMADLVRGAVIPPGGTFSINDHVGERTEEGGFVGAGAIRDGQHVTEVGGGVSQFATTLFNAAYFAGLDIDTYQAHSEYFSRYPRGREATMGFPAPDLVIANNTPHGVMIWTSYTDTSLTVTLYSTPFASGEQTGIVEERAGNCTVVTTTRTRTFVDGREPVTDTFRATYRPGEGQFC